MLTLGIETLRRYRPLLENNKNLRCFLVVSQLKDHETFGGRSRTACANI